VKKGRESVVNKKLCSHLASLSQIIHDDKHYY